MKSYRLPIADAPKQIAAIYRRDLQKHCCINVLTHGTESRPRPCSASGTLPYFLATALQLPNSTGQGTRSVAMRRGRATGGSHAA
jgi:hypothetical protein